MYGLKIVLTNRSLLIKCTPLDSQERGKPWWGLWAGTIAVEGSGPYKMGQRILFHEDAIVQVLKHDAPMLRKGECKHAPPESKHKREK